MYTLGPWKNDRLIIRNESGELIAKTESSMDDARLIAAAPDMLFELKMILKRLELELFECFTRSFRRAHMDDISRVIAKAEGI